MAGTPEGYIESTHEGGATPTDDLDDEVEGDAGAPPRLWVEHDSSSSRNTRSSSKRSSAMETVGVRMLCPTT